MFRREACMLYIALNNQTLGHLPGVCVSRTGQD